MIAWAEPSGPRLQPDISRAPTRSRAPQEATDGWGVAGKQGDDGSSPIPGDLTFCPCRAAPLYSNRARLPMPSG